MKNLIFGIKSRFRLCRYLIITRDIGNNMWPSRELTYVMNCLLFVKKPFLICAYKHYQVFLISNLFVQVL